MLKGIGASPGIAIGRVLVKSDQKIEVERKNIENFIEELEKLAASINIAREQIEKLYNHTLKNIGEEEAKIFEAHLMMLDDPDFFGQVREKVKAESINAEWALKEVTENFVMIFKNMDNEYMKERAADLKDVSNRVIKILLSVRFFHLFQLQNLLHFLYPYQQYQKV